MLRFWDRSFVALHVCIVSKRLPGVPVLPGLIFTSSLSVRVEELDHRRIGVVGCLALEPVSCACHDEQLTFDARRLEPFDHPLRLLQIHVLIPRAVNAKGGSGVLCYPGERTRFNVPFSSFLQIATKIERQHFRRIGAFAVRFCQVTGAKETNDALDATGLI